MTDADGKPSKRQLMTTDTDLAIETSAALRHLTVRLLHPSETNRDRRDFYAHYQLYLTEIIDLVRRVPRSARSDNQFVRRILGIHESFFDKNHLNTTDRGPYPYLMEFIDLWERCKGQHGGEALSLIHI